MMIVADLQPARRIARNGKLDGTLPSAAESHPKQQVSFHHRRPRAAEPQPKDEKIFNHKERKDHKKEWRAGFPIRLG
jgi:hypothetical protein